MKTKIALIAFVCFSFQTIDLMAQPAKWEFTSIAGNNTKVDVSVFGSLGDRNDPDNPNSWNFLLNNVPGQTNKNSFRNTSLLLGGLDSDNELRITAINFFKSKNQSFYPGLVSIDGTVVPDPNMIFNYVWKIKRIEIENLKTDWLTNQIIEGNVSYDVKYWPGKGNPFFKSDLGFELPDQQLAPFFDRNNDGKYNVYDGDLPEASKSNPGIVFEELCWSAYYDTFIDLAINANPIELQFYISTYTTLCEDLAIMNSVVFQDFTIVNSSVQSIDSFFVGMLSKATLFGLNNETYIGTNIDQSSQYTYSNTPNIVDGLTHSAAITVLNQKLTNSIYYLGAGGNFPPGMEDPTSSTEYYRYLSGTWRDGSTIKPIGNGYNPSSTLPSTKYIFFDPPKQVDGFSMYQNQIYLNGLTIVGASGNITFKPGDNYNVSYAFSFHQDADVNAPDPHLKHVDKMFEEVPQIREYYNSNFESCKSPMYCSGPNCMWPGDMDNNQQVDFRDMVYLAVGKGQTGPKRNTNTAWLWFPQFSTDWSNSIPNSNINFKRLDASGDGKLEWLGDEEVIRFNKDRTVGDKPLSKFSLSLGQGIIFDRIFNGLAKDTILNPNSSALININIGSTIDIPDVAGIAFNISYNSWVFNELNNSYIMFKDFQSESSAVQTFEFKNKDDSDGTVNYESVWVRNDSQDKDLKGLMSRLLLKLRTDAWGNGGLDTTWIELRGLRAIKANGESVQIGTMSIPVLYQSKTTVSTNEPNIKGTILVYPNPLIGNRLNIETKESILSYRITDVLGREIVSQKLVAGTSEITLVLNPGPYSLGLLTSEGWVNQLLIKQ